MVIRITGDGTPKENPKVKKFLADRDYDADAPLSCPACGWVGTGAGNEEFYDALFDVCCPECNRMLLIVTFSTVGETRQAAADGDPSAVASLPDIEERQKRYEHLLTTSEQLPDIAGSSVRIDWDCEVIDDEPWTVLRSDGAEIWCEPVFWEGVGRFAKAFEILRARYGTRLVEVRPTEASLQYLYGDDLRAPVKIDRLNASLHPD